MPDSCELRQRKYLNNLVEQDHREHQTAREARDGFFSFETAWRTLQGFEIINMFRKGQIGGIEKGDSMKQATCIASLFGVTL